MERSDPARESHAPQRRDQKSVLSVGEVLERAREPEGQSGGERMRGDSAQGDKE